MNDPHARAIERLFERFTSAFNAKDLETLEASYSEDALLIPPGQTSIRGADAIIQGMWAPTFDAFDVEAALPIHEIEVAGDWAFVRGTYRLRLDPVGGGDPLHEQGRYIDVVRKDADGPWKIARAIWNVGEG